MAGEITQFIDPDGAITTLVVDWDAENRFMPKVVHETDGTPGQPGSRIRASRHDVRDFTIRAVFVTSDELTLRAAQRAIVRTMDPVRGTGKIRVTSPIGDVREIAVRYSDGLGMTEKPDMSGPTMQFADITFTAFDPYWYDTSSASQTFTIGAVPSFFPFFPLRLTSSQIVVDGTITNTGDIECWPVFTITGPGSVIVIRNLTTGANIIFSTLVLGSGESVVVDTGPPTVKKNDGTNVYPDLDINSTLWAIQPGTNVIRMEMAGAVAGVSALTVSYKQRYLSP